MATRASLAEKLCQIRSIDLLQLACQFIEGMVDAQPGSPRYAYLDAMGSDGIRRLSVQQLPAMVAEMTALSPLPTD